MERGILQAGAGVEEPFQAVAEVVVPVGQPAVNRFLAVL